MNYLLFWASRRIPNGSVLTWASRRISASAARMWAFGGIATSACLVCASRSLQALTVSTLMPYR